MAALYFGREVFVPLALAALLSFLLVPASALLERWGIRRGPAALIVVFVSLAAIASLTWVMLGQIYNLAVELPQYQQNITQGSSVSQLGVSVQIPGCSCAFLIFGSKLFLNTMFAIGHPFD